MAYLNTVIDPLKPYEDHGKAAFVATRQIVREILSN